MEAANEARTLDRMSEILGRAEHIEEMLLADHLSHLGKLQDPSGLVESERFARLREDARVLTGRLRETVDVLKSRIHPGTA